MGAVAEAGFEFYRQRARAAVVPDPDSEAELAWAWAEGDREAGARLVEANLAFVIRVAREYRRWGIPLDDLVQQGNLGLLKAAERFDPSRQIPLRAYAGYWIRAEIRDYVLRMYRIVRLGSTRTERRAMRAYRSTAVDSPRALAELSGMPLERCEKLWPLLGQPDRSLDMTQRDRTTYMERLHDRGGTPEDHALEAQERHLTTKRVHAAFGHLSEREQRIIRGRIMDEEPMTLEQLGTELGLSRERVRQLEQRARTKIRTALAS